MNEKQAWSISGYPIIVVVLAWIALCLYMLITGIMYDGGPAAIVPYLIGGPITTAAMVAGFVMVQPKQSKVLVLFGAYNGTLSETGLRWSIRSIIHVFQFPYAFEILRAAKTRSMTPMVTQLKSLRLWYGG